MDAKDRELNRQHENDRIKHPLMEYYRHVFQDSVRWDGEADLTNKDVVVYMEQGFGDVIQFLRYVPLLKKKKKCKQVIVAAPPELKELIENGTNAASLVHPKNNPDLPPHDFHILSFSLPFLLSDDLVDRGISHTSFPYVSIASKKDLSDIEGFKIGVCWEGSPSNKYNAWRSIPLAHFHKIQELWEKKGSEPVRLFSLQREIHNPERLKGCEDMELLGVEINSFMDTAELIQSLDLVITIDSAPLHLAGSMNKKSYLLLCNAASDGRYGTEGTSTRWYPSVKVIRNSADPPDIYGVPKFKSPISGWSEAFDVLLDDLESCYLSK